MKSFYATQDQRTPVTVGEHGLPSNSAAIPKKISDANEAIHTLMERILELSSRLEPVLRSPFDKPAPGRETGGCETPRNASGISLLLDGLRAGTCDCIAAVDEIIARLEV